MSPTLMVRLDGEIVPLLFIVTVYVVGPPPEAGVGVGLPVVDPVGVGVGVVDELSEPIRYPAKRLFALFEWELPVPPLVLKAVVASVPQLEIILCCPPG